MHPWGFAPKICPHAEAFESLLLPGGTCQGRPHGVDICLYTIFATFRIFIIIARIGDWQHFGVALKF